MAVNFLKGASYVCLFAVLYGFFGFLVSILSTCMVLLCTGGYRDIIFWLYIIRRDVKTFWFFATDFIPSLKAAQKETIAQLFLKTARKFPHKKALVLAETGNFLTFKDMEVFINKIGHIFRKTGYKNGDSVALIMENDLAYIPIWMGLSKIGITVALINCNLHGKSLEHCLSIVDFKAIICHQHLKEILKQIGFVDKPTIEVFTVSENINEDDEFDLNNLLAREDSTDPSEESIIAHNQPVCYIYTSGSTGKPKAANYMQTKITGTFGMFKSLLGLSADDVVYNCLPLYHSSGGVLMMSPTVMLGCTTIIRKKFSPSRFINECIEHDVAFVCYIGEMLRYLLSQPPRGTDKKHKIKVIAGNGLRGSLVAELKERFDFNNIIEMYGASEGNFGLWNPDNTPGALGFHFRIFPFLNSSVLVKVDAETGELIRDKRGRAIECGVQEAGMLVGSVNKNAPYYGYKNNEKESKKKIAHDVFHEGDHVFMSGDLFVKDEYSYLYFVDRIGDTFRWKSENVSTTEVENIISMAVSSAEDVVVYPVKVPGNEGNAGMALIREKQGVQFSIEGVATELAEQLPRYALPIFIKITRSIDQTGTFKYQKSSLKRQGYNLEHLGGYEKIYVYDVTKKNYVVLDSELFGQIENGEMKF